MNSKSLTPVKLCALALASVAVLHGCATSSSSDSESSTPEPAVTVPTNTSDLPEVTMDGLVRLPNTRLEVVYIDPDADFSVYNKIMLVEPTVSFKKDWLRDQNRYTRTASGRVTERDMDEIKVALAQEFNVVFGTVLQESDGYMTVSEPGEDVMLIKPAIINLDVTSPSTMSRTMGVQSFSESAGAMTLQLELFDSLTGDSLAKGLDRKDDYQQGFVSWDTSGSNRQAADRILTEWARILRTGLDDAHASAK